jgi:chorismate mutase/prephenate dehydratase
MENQQKKSYEPALQAIRGEIDAIDEKIISLLEERMKIISKVAELKKNHQEKFFIRANREADMIKNLVKKTNLFPKAIVVDMWRKIITAANMHEQRLQVGIHNPRNISDYSYLIREYYSDIVPILNFDSATNLVAEMQKGEINIAAFTLPHEGDEQRKEDFGENWWISLANNNFGLKVFAKIPFVQNSAIEKKYDAIELVLMAVKEPEKSSSDHSLFYVELADNFSKSQLASLFKASGIEAKILKQVKLPQVEGIKFYLLEAEGFFLENDEVFKILKKSEIRPYIKILGHFATSINV